MQLEGDSSAHRTEGIDLLLITLRLCGASRGSVAMASSNGGASGSSSVGRASCRLVLLLLFSFAASGVALITNTTVKVSKFLGIGISKQLLGGRIGAVRIHTPPLLECDMNVAPIPDLNGMERDFNNIARVGPVLPWLISDRWT